MRTDTNVLKLTKPMMHGPAVKRLQELGDLLGYDIGPNDGIFGPDTEAVVMMIQLHNGLKSDGICGPKTWATLTMDVDRHVDDGSIEIGTDNEVSIHDRRDKHLRPKLYRCPRTWDQLTGVTLHQTGCQMPQRPEGWDRLNAHIGITQEGRVILANPLTDFIWHAQGLSRQTIGIEIEGNYCGLDGNMKTLWKGGGGPDHLNQEMKAALNRAFQWIQNEIEQNGKQWYHVFAHRQSKDTRIADPGEEIWKQVALPWLGRLDATDGGPKFRLGSGRPIPKEWDPKRSQNKYFK